MQTDSLYFTVAHHSILSPPRNDLMIGYRKTSSAVTTFIDFLHQNQVNKIQIHAFLNGF